jgi:hypothetical protein
MAQAAAQVPHAGDLTLDHVAHYVPDIDIASAALEKLGFTLTPLSNQSHRLETGGALVPAGTANRCVMLERGYLEFLTPTLSTPIAAQLRTAIDRYVGVHLIAFGSASPEADCARLSDAGFDPLTPVALQRPIGTESGEETARFTVVRVPPGTMAEGRIQFCQHHTPDLLWQGRWLSHANGAVALSSVLLCVDDPDAAASRYARFTGLTPSRSDNCWVLKTARGSLVFASAGAVRSMLGIASPALPWIAGYTLEVRDLTATRDCLDAASVRCRELGAGRLLVELPESVGGAIVFTAPRVTAPL